MLVGYARVSKADGSQVTDLQRDALVQSGIDPAFIYEDMASGKRDDRPGLLSCLKALREGDTLVVWKLDRLGRNLQHLVNTVDDLAKRNIGFKVLAGQGANIDTTSPNGKLVFTGQSSRSGGEARTSSFAAATAWCSSPRLDRSSRARSTSCR